MAFDTLFSPFSIGSLKLENRLVMPPMATNYASPEGFVTERQIDYYVERARGGAGYLTVEHTGILPQGKASPKMLLISSDEHASHIKRLVEAVHAAGGKIVVQINHAGADVFGRYGFAHRRALPHTRYARHGDPHALSEVEIEALVNAYTAAAERVKQTGADGVEIHMAHGYLLCPFYLLFPTRGKIRMERI